MPIRAKHVLLLRLVCDSDRVSGELEAHGPHHRGSMHHALVVEPEYIVAEFLAQVHDSLNGRVVLRVLGKIPNFIVTVRRPALVGWGAAISMPMESE